MFRAAWAEAPEVIERQRETFGELAPTDETGERASLGYRSFWTTRPAAFLTPNPTSPVLCLRAGTAAPFGGGLGTLGAA